MNGPSKQELIKQTEATIRHLEKRVDSLMKNYYAYKKRLDNARKKLRNLKEE